MGCVVWDWDAEQKDPLTQLLSMFQCKTGCTHKLNQELSKV